MAGQPTPGSNPFITFDVTALTVTEAGLAPTSVIENGRSFEVKVSFTFAGLIAPFLVGLGVPCTVTVRFESLGDGPEGFAGPITVTTVPGTLNYTGTVPVAAADPLSTVGTYRLVGSVVIPGSPLAGFIDGNILQIIAS